MELSEKEILNALGAGWVKVNTASDEDVEVWDFKEKPIFKGIYLRTVEYDSSFGGRSKIHFVEDPDHKQWKIFGNHIIDSHFSTAEAGLEVGLVYHGKLKGKKGNMYHAFDVYKNKGE